MIIVLCVLQRGKFAAHPLAPFNAVNIAAAAFHYVKFLFQEIEKGELFIVGHEPN